MKVYAATVIAGDCELRRFTFPILYRLPLRLFIGLIKPIRVTILGQELAGEIEAVGKGCNPIQTRRPGICTHLVPFRCLCRVRLSA